MSKPISSDRYCVHQVTLNQCDFEESINILSNADIYKIALWKEKVHQIGVKRARQILDSRNVDAIALCAGGLVTHKNPVHFQQALDNNKQWIEDAAALGADSLIFITGGLEDFDKDLAGARYRALEGIDQLVAFARDANVVLTLEPLHPMVCGNRSVISTLGDANDALDQLGYEKGVALAVDTYALWWQADLQTQIKRAGKRIRHFHVADWLANTQDIRLDRGMPGDGLIDNRMIRQWLEDIGFNGAVEVEIFSQSNWWKRSACDVVKTILNRYKEVL